MPQGPDIPFRYDRSDTHPVVTRVVERAGRARKIHLLARADRWLELIAPGAAPGPRAPVWVPCPGARDLTVREYVGSAAHPAGLNSEWIDVPADVAGSDTALVEWFSQHAELLPSGVFRVRSWSGRWRDPIDLPFLPEFDDPDEAIQQLAAVEAWRRSLASQLEAASEMRRGAVAAASAAGHSRRSLGRLLDLSYTRVQQLLAEASDP